MYSIILTYIFKATIPHILAWVHQNIKLHPSFIYLYQTRILIQNISLNIKLSILLSINILKALQRFLIDKNDLYIIASITVLKCTFYVAVSFFFKIP